MSFSSEEPLNAGQSPESITLPPIKNPDLFEDVVEDLFKSISSSVNTKAGGLYTLQEKGNFEKYYRSGNPQEFRNGYRKVMDFVDLNGANIGASASVDFEHNISQLKEAAMIYANCTATDGRRFTVVFPDVWATSTRAFFSNPIAVALNQVDVVLNYLKEE